MLCVVRGARIIIIIPLLWLLLLCLLLAILFSLVVGPGFEDKSCYMRSIQYVTIIDMRIPCMEYVYKLYFPFAFVSLCFRHRRCYHFVALPIYMIFDPGIFFFMLFRYFRK